MVSLSMIEFPQKALLTAKSSENIVVYTNLLNIVLFFAYSLLNFHVVGGNRAGQLWLIKDCNKRRRNSNVAENLRWSNHHRVEILQSYN